MGNSPGTNKNGVEAYPNFSNYLVNAQGTSGSTSSTKENNDSDDVSCATFCICILFRHNFYFCINKPYFCEIDMHKYFTVSSKRYYCPVVYEISKILFNC